MTLDRRSLLASGAALAAAPALAQTEPPMMTRPIPQGSGQRIPVVGSGSANIYDFQDNPAFFEERRQTLEVFKNAGNILIDTAPSYGRAEDRIGDLLQTTGWRNNFFLATKTRANQEVAAHTAEMERSKVRLKTDHFELMQYHNVSRATQDFGLLREWKRQGICKYIGMTSTSDGSYAVLEQLIAREKPEFVQVDYAIDNRNVEEKVLPMCADNGCAVLTALPFGRNRLFQRTANVPLPDFAREIGAASWAQFFLKYLISHPAVTCVIPGTDKPQYARDNLGAGRGPMPDAAMRARMAAFVDGLPG